MLRYLLTAAFSVILGCGGSSVDSCEPPCTGDQICFHGICVDAPDGGDALPDGAGDGRDGSEDGEASPDGPREDAGDGDADAAEAMPCTPLEACEDGNPCTEGETCDAEGVCGGGSPVSCADDENPCTSNVCDVGWGGCYPPVAGECNDGNPCSTGDHCADGVCVATGGFPIWYRDEDGDGFGRNDDTQCGETAPEGYVAEGGDCCDLTGDISPGRGEFGEPERCGEGIGAPTIADLNCNGDTEQRWPDAGVCESDGSGGCRLVEGWQTSPMGGVPNCGQGGMFITACNHVVVTCTAQASWRTQTCR